MIDIFSLCKLLIKSDSLYHLMSYGSPTKSKNSIFLLSLFQKRDYVRLSPVNSLGSSANSSPGNGGNGTDPSHDPHSFSNNYRSLAYLPGSVHGASMGHNPLQQQQQNPNNNTALPSITTLGNAGKYSPRKNIHSLTKQD